jgi:hypothetical protein
VKWIRDVTDVTDVTSKDDNKPAAITCKVCDGRGEYVPASSGGKRGYWSRDDGDHRVYIVTDWPLIIVVFCVVFLLGRCSL